jgi:hypothetical protein
VKKHQPNVFWRYKQIHTNVMDQFRHSGFIRADDLTFSDEIEGRIRLAGHIECAGWIYLRVTKDLRVISGRGEMALVQTEWYSYNVALEGEGNILRHDSPHPHRSEDRKGIVTVIRTGAHPTLGQVIGEARDWFYANVDEIMRRRVGDL